MTALKQSAFAASAAVIWMLVITSPYLELAPELDAMVTYREALEFHKIGFAAFIANATMGVHPPLLDFLSAAAFSVFGRIPLAQRMVALLLVAIVAAAMQRFFALTWRESQTTSRVFAEKQPCCLLSVFAAVVVIACPLISVNLFLLMREGLLIAILAVGLAIAAAIYVAVVSSERYHRAAATFWLWLPLGLVLALLPLAKETGIVFLPPFMAFAFFVSGANIRPQGITRWLAVTAVTLPALLSTAAWKITLALNGGHVWASWVFTDDKTESPYVTGLRALAFGFDKIYLTQNAANAFVVNFLWVPTLLACFGLINAVITAVKFRQGKSQALSWSAAPLVVKQQSALRALLLLTLGCLISYCWTVLPFPTWTIPRYAAPATFLVVTLALLALPLAFRYVAVVLLGMLFGVANWASVDPVSCFLYGTARQGGERIYDADWNWRGPDRMMINMQILQASQRLTERLRAVYASDVNVVAGDCADMKVGEKMWSIAQDPSAYPMFPGARPLACVAFEQLPPSTDLANYRIAVFLPQGLSTMPDSLHNAAAVTLIP